MNNNNKRPLLRFFKLAAKIEEDEAQATLLSFSFIFMLMFANNMLGAINLMLACGLAIHTIAILKRHVLTHRYHQWQ